MKSIFQTAGWLITLCALVAPVRADVYVVDQRNEFDGSGLVPFFAIGFVSSVGQEFTPATNSLSYVDMITIGGGAVTANLQVLIRLESITNSVLAASDLVLVTNSMTVGTNRFRFTPSVSLVPSSKYVMEIVPIGVWGVGASDDTYPLGQMIFHGQPYGYDLWFREGVIVPAPDSPLLSIRISHISQITVSWSSSSSKTYQVQYSSELTTNIWTDLGSPVPGNGLTNSVIDAIDGLQRYYRVITLP